MVEDRNVEDSESKKPKVVLLLLEQDEPKGMRWRTGRLAGTQWALVVDPVHGPCVGRVQLEGDRGPAS